jgi:hypothetical protein
LLATELVEHTLFFILSRKTKAKDGEEEKKDGEATIELKHRNRRETTRKKKV